jgi:hypothetical protein
MNAMSTAIQVVLFVALVGWWLGTAILADRVAERKGRIGGVYLPAGLVIGPISLLAALILPRRHAPPERARRSRR